MLVTRIASASIHSIAELATEIAQTAPHASSWQHFSEGMCPPALDNCGIIHHHEIHSNHVETAPLLPRAGQCFLQSVSGASTQRSYTSQNLHQRSYCPNAKYPTIYKYPCTLVAHHPLPLWTSTPNHQA